MLKCKKSVENSSDRYMTTNFYPILKDELVILNGLISQDQIIGKSQYNIGGSLNHKRKKIQNNKSNEISSVEFDSNDYKDFMKNHGGNHSLIQLNYDKENESCDSLKSNSTRQISCLDLNERNENSEKESLIDNRIYDLIMSTYIQNSKNKECESDNKTIFKVHKVELDKYNHKCNLSLKQISNSVIRILEENKITSYKEILKELENLQNLICFQVNATSKSKNHKKDTKNIKRRIYDVLNVMKEINLFSLIGYDKKNLSIISNIFKYENKNQSIKSFEEISLELRLQYKKSKIVSLRNKFEVLKDFIEKNKESFNSIPESEKIFFPCYMIKVDKNCDKIEIMNENSKNETISEVNTNINYDENTFIDSEMTKNKMKDSQILDIEFNTLLDENSIKLNTKDFNRFFLKFLINTNEFENSSNLSPLNAKCNLLSDFPFLDN